ncbi:MAG: fasciclin domain-containing protein [Bacteroidaceae bacterium]|nr:fasciclin domain-containing protein [Bacteroidaceae bacterium]
MKRPIFYILQLTFCAGLLTSCGDEWNDHFDASTVDNGTLWQAIEAQEDLSNFAQVVEACGYDKVLDGSQTYSVFAPTNETFSKREADSLVSEFQRQAAAGTRSNDNTVVRQFLQNHIALYKHPVSSLTADSIVMMNDKYMRLTPSTLSERNLLSTNALYNNGLLFTIDRKLDYFPNVFEYLGHDHDLDSVYSFFNRYNTYEFSEAKSVPGEIVDGMTVYLDSVSELQNVLFASYGLINSEDSTYWLLCPTNDEWNRMVEEYEPYFTYPTTVNNRDSLQYINTRLAIMDGAFFSRTANPDEAFQDSAISTKGETLTLLRRYGINDDESYYVYQRPFDEGGIFDGTEDVVCSNGHVRKASHYNLSKYETFLQTIKVEAENIIYQDTIIQAVDPLVMREVTSSNPFYGQISGNAFVEVQPDPATAQVTVGYRVPDVLSNVEYDVYAVFVPATAYDTLAVKETEKPYLVRSTLYYSNEYGKESPRRFNSRITVPADSVREVLLAKQQTFPTSSAGLPATLKLWIASAVTSSQTTTHSTTLRLDCILFKPHAQEATEEKAVRRSHK